MTLLHYSLQKTNDGLVLQILCDKIPLSFDKALKVAKLGIDQEILAYLKKERERLSKTVKLKEDLTLIGAKSSLSLFKLLAASGRFYFESLKIVVDFFRPINLVMTLDPNESGGAIAKLWMQEESKRIALSELRLCHPPIVLINSILRFFPSEWDLQWCRWNEQVWSRQEVKERLEFLELDPESGPKVEWLKSAKPLKTIEPRPVLKLTDRMGAFANLYMEYEAEQIAYNPQNKEEALFEKDLLEIGYLRKPNLNSTYYCPIDKACEALLFLLELGWTILDFQGRRVTRLSQATFAIEDDKKQILAKGSVAFGEDQLPLGPVVDHYQRNENLISLNEGTVGLLDRGLLQHSLGSILEGEIVGGAISFKRHQAPHLASHWVQEPQTVDQKALWKLIHSKGSEAQILPSPEFKAILRPYQQEGLNWLHCLKESGLGGILADEMGLGKTVQILALLSTLDRPGPILIVMPTSLLFQWESEFHRFLPSWNVRVCRKKEELALSSHFDALLISFATLRLASFTLASMQWEGIIVDEAQMIKNAQTQAAQALRQLQAPLRLTITGTPVENRLEELWSQFQFLIPGMLGSYAAFKAKATAAQVDFRFLQQIKKQVHPFILRRCKEQVASDLPPKIEQTVLVDMGDELSQAYAELIGKAKSGLLKKIRADGSISSHRMEILETLLRLRQLCCHPALLGLDSDIECHKWLACLEDIQTALDENNKVILFSQFTSVLKLFVKQAHDRAWPLLYLDGQTQDRLSLVKQFQENPAPQLFLISLKAGGVGLNLSEADFVILYDPWWNEAVENQAIDRAHRIGRTRPVIAKRYITSGTIEEKMMALKEKKQKLAQSVAADDGELVGNWTVEDLEFLLE